MKMFITVLAVVGFALTATAQKSTKPVEKPKEQRTREQETPAQRAAREAKDVINGAREANETAKISKTEMRLEDFSLIKDEGTRNKIEELAQKYEDKVNNHDNFTVKVASALVKIAKANPNESEKAQILKFIEESVTLMSLKGESGTAARNAMSVLVTELTATPTRPAKKLDDAIYSAMKAAFPNHSEKDLAIKIKEFKKNCLGQA